MNKGFVAVVSFIAGAAAGAFAAWKVVKTKYEKIADDEINAIREHYRSKKTEKKDAETTEEASESDPAEAQEYVDLATRYNADAVPVEGDKPYIITPDDYGEIDEHDIVSMTYYSDGKLVDDEWNVMPNEDIEDFIGLEALRRFGEFEPDAVYVRNEERLMDIEVLRDYRTYQEAFETERVTRWARNQ